MSVAGCGGNGVPMSTNMASVLTGNGYLMFMPGAPDSSAECSYVPFDPSSTVLAVIAQVHAVLVGSGDQTFLRVHSGTDSVALSTSANGSLIGVPLFYVNDSGTAAQLSADYGDDMYWRITFQTSNTITFQTSIDAKTWLDVGSSPIKPDTPDNVTVEVGIYSATGTTTPTAEIGLLYYCK
jgi:hypothetical protein